MPKNLEVEPKTAEKLNQLAASRSMSIDELLAIYIPELNASATDGVDPNELGDSSSAFEEWASSFDKVGAPPLSDEAISRESIYRDR